MRIKVITLKDIINYSLKFGFAFGIIAIITNFFYNKKNVNTYIAFDSSIFISTIKNEILPLKQQDENNSKKEKNTYISKTINSEFNMMELVANINNKKDLSIKNLINTDDNVDNSQRDNQNNNNNTEAIDVNNIPTEVSTEVLPSSIPDKSTYEIFGVKLRSECDYDLEKEITDLNANFNKNNILIFHTHTCESYTPTEQYNYESTGNYRTTDLNYSVARVGDELEKYLKEYGFSVIHDKSYHDYPSYNGSYNRSLVTVKKLLENNSNIDVVIDLHRDAIGDNTYAPKVQIGDDCCARIMFVIGTDGGGLSHDGWRNNLKFAMKIVQKGNELYPGFFKPIIVRNSRYNHHLSNAACIIEVGATGNTLEECMNSMKYLAKIYSEVQ